MRLKVDWVSNPTFQRAYSIESETGDTVAELGETPTLDELRDAERRTGERIVLTDLGIPCHICSSAITDRFGADPNGNLLCWQCAINTEHESQSGIRVNTDPTKATISRSRLYEKSLCDYVVNVATGCKHGCKFCYVPTTPGYEARENMLEQQADVESIQGEWGSYLLYRDDLPERLHEELNNGLANELEASDRGRGVVMLSSGTDPYQDRRAGQISRATIQELIQHEVPVRVLTRSSSVIRDLDVFRDVGDLITVGSSIPSFDEELVRCLEPGAPPPERRWETLNEIQSHGVPVFVSMSPTYPSLNETRLRELLTRFNELNPRVVFHEPINPRGKNFEMIVHALEEQGFNDLAEQFRELSDPHNWVRYALIHINRVQQVASEIDGLHVHSWPDREIVEATTGRLRDDLVAMRESPSPEWVTRGDPPGISDSHAPIFDSYRDVKDSVKPHRIT